MQGRALRRGGNLGWGYTSGPCLGVGGGLCRVLGWVPLTVSRPSVRPCVSPRRARPRMAEGGPSDSSSPGSLRPGLPGARGLLGRRPAAPPLTPGRLPSIRSRDLTLGGVKKVRTLGGGLPQNPPF